MLDVATNPRIKEIVAKYVSNQAPLEETEVDYIEQQKREKQEAINLNKNELYEIKEDDFEDNETSFV